MSRTQSAPAAQKPSASVTLPSGITSLTVVSSTQVAAGLADGRVAIWSPGEAAPSLLQPHTARVVTIATTTGGKEVLSVAADGTLARTPTVPGAKAVVSKVDFGSQPVVAAVFSPDGTQLVTGGERGELRVIVTATGAATVHSGHRTELHAVATQPGTSVVASASAEADLRLWDAVTGKELKRVGCGLALLALAFNPQDGTLASGGVARRLTLYNPRTFETTGELVLERPNMISALAWSPDGRRIAIGHIDSDSLRKGGIRILDAGSHRVLAMLDTGGRPTGVIAFAGGGNTVFSAIGRDLAAWTLAEQSLQSNGI